MSISDIVVQPVKGTAQGVVKGAEVTGATGAVVAGAATGIPGAVVGGAAGGLVAAIPAVISALIFSGPVGWAVLGVGVLLGAATGGIVFGGAGAVGGGLGGGIAGAAGGGALGLFAGVFKGIAGFVEGIFTKIAPGPRGDTQEVRNLRAQSAAADAQLQAEYMNRRQQIAMAQAAAADPDACSTDHAAKLAAAAEQAKSASLS